MNFKINPRFFILILIAANTHAMESLDDSKLQDVTGQAGADLSIKLTLNHNSSSNFSCDDKVYCRLALSLNNRYHDGSQDTYTANGTRTPSTTGRQQWMVMKGVQGTVNIQEIKLDGDDVTYGTNTQAAIKLGFTKTKPIQIRNFGFQSLSIETDTCTNANTNCVTGTTNLPGYLVSATAPSTWTNAYDNTREKGFLGLNMHGNLVIDGTLKVFSCGSNHSRC